MRSEMETVEQVQQMWLAWMCEHTGLSSDEVLSVVAEDHEFWSQRPGLARVVARAMRGDND